MQRHDARLGLLQNASVRSADGRPIECSRFMYAPAQNERGGGIIVPGAGWHPVDRRSSQHRGALGGRIQSSRESRAQSPVRLVKSHHLVVPRIIG